MAKARSPNRDKAFEIWKEHDGNITNREIAKLLDEDEKKIAVWKQRDKWNVVQQKKQVHPKAIVMLLDMVHRQAIKMRLVIPVARPNEIKML